MANETIDGQQCTIAWYMDDNGIMHKDKNILKNFFCKICEVCGKIELNTGDTHEFLGMSITIHRYYN